MFCSISTHMLPEGTIYILISIKPHFCIENDSGVSFHKNILFIRYKLVLFGILLQKSETVA